MRGLLLPEDAPNKLQPPGAFQQRLVWVLNEGVWGLRFQWSVLTCPAADITAFSSAILPLALQVLIRTMLLLCILLRHSVPIWAYGLPRSWCIVWRSAVLFWASRLLRSQRVVIRSVVLIWALRGTDMGTHWY